MEHKMKCTESRNRISKLVWEKVPLETDGELTTHMQKCASCSLFYQNYLLGIGSVLEDKRIVPDPDLWSRIESRMLRDRLTGKLNLPNEGMAHSDYKESLNNRANTASEHSNHATIMRLTWYSLAGAAAILAGILIGNNFAFSSYLNTDKQLYRQEISLQSDDLSGLNAGLIDYYTYEKELSDE